MTRHRDRGEANALGLVLIAPVAIALAILILWLGRKVDADAQVQAASSAAAQAAARQRTPAAAAGAAQAAATTMLADANGVLRWPGGVDRHVQLSCRGRRDGGGRLFAATFRPSARRRALDDLRGDSDGIDRHLSSRGIAVSRRDDLGDGGSATVLMITLCFSFLAGSLVWLSRTVDQSLDDRTNAAAIAFQAARAGAQTLDPASTRAGVVVVDPVAARRVVNSTVQHLLTANGDTGSAIVLSIDGARVTVIGHHHDDRSSCHRHGLRVSCARCRRTAAVKEPLMSPQVHTRSGARFIGALAATIAVVVGLPALLVAVALQRFDHVSPLHGVNAPWRWSLDDLRSWAVRLTHGLDSSAQLVDLFFRVALIVGWICVAILIYTVVDEVVFQMRHGMPSAHHRNLIGLGSLGRKVASVLVAVLPLVVNTDAVVGGCVIRSAGGGGRSASRDDRLSRRLPTRTLAVADPGHRLVARRGAPG